jgi:hypothetical protein
MMEKKPFDPTNRGTLSRNKKKESPTHADYNGQINVNSTEYWLNGWIKEGPEGKFLSLSIKPKTPAARQSSEPTRKSQSSGFDDMSDDIPF